MNSKYINVIYEDNHVIAINKSSGTLVQGDKTGDKSLIDFTKNFLKKKYNKPGNVFIGLPHRIDRPVSGIVLLSKTSKSLSRLTILFKEKKIEKKSKFPTEKLQPNSISKHPKSISRDRTAVNSFSQSCDFVFLTQPRRKFRKIENLKKSIKCGYLTLDLYHRLVKNKFNFVCFC